MLIAVVDGRSVGGSDRGVGDASYGVCDCCGPCGRCGRHTEWLSFQPFLH